MNTIKQLMSMMAVAVVTCICFASCSNDIVSDEPMRSGEVDITMTTSLPQELQTYALTSSEGGLKNLEGVQAGGKNLAVRYIMEIYPKGSETAVQRKIVYKPLTSEGDYRSASFSTRLLAAEYNFVFWADIVREASSIPYSQALEGLKAPFYGNSYFFSNIETSDEPLEVLYHPLTINTSEKGDLKTIHSSGVGAAAAPVSSEMYDGYTCTKTVDLRTEPTTTSFILERPFAKLRVISTDEEKDLVVKPNWAESLLKIALGSNIPNRFNALTGDATTDSNVGQGYWSAYYSESGTYDDETGDAHTIGVFYLPVSSSSYNLNFKIGITAIEGATTDLDLAVDNVPLVANKLTTIKGKILSKKTDITITINDEFEDDETIIEVGKEASTVDALKAAMTGKDETITYTGNITKENGFELDFTNVARTTPVYAEDNNTTLTLAFASIEDGAVLTFKGSNAPKTLRIKTDTKCSLRIDLPKTDINYDGSSYKYIVSNAGCKTKREGAVYEVMFRAGNGSGFYSYTNSDYDESHLYKINADFTLPANIECLNDIMHESGSCSWASKLKAGDSVWNFVGDSKN